MDCYMMRRKIAESFNIYKSGDEVTALTGGYASYAELAYVSFAGTSVDYAVLAKLSSTMRVSWGNSPTGWYNGVVRIGNMIDLSGISKIRIHSPGCQLAPVRAGGYEAANVYIRDSADTYWDASESMKTNNSNFDTVTGSGTYELDVSAYDGYRYVGIGTRLNDANSFSYFDISQIELIR